MRTALTVILVLLAATAAIAQTATVPQIQQVPAPYTSPASGQEMYEAYCASCHGVDGDGLGPAAPAMKSAVPDLTTLAKRSGGEFPAFSVSQQIVGDRLVSAHGSKDMPVWGPVFSRLSQQRPAEVIQRVANLTSYIKSLQK